MGEYCNNYPGSISEEPNGEFTHWHTDISLCSSVHEHEKKIWGCEQLLIKEVLLQSHGWVVAYFKVLYYPKM